MTQSDNILQELIELESSLANRNMQHVYHVPKGYFEGLAEQVLRRIKANDAMNAADELGHLSPLLATISKQGPYAVPEGYFDTVAEDSFNVARTGEQTPADELATLSPLLGGLNKKMLYSLPAGYFEKLDATSNTGTRQQGKVVSMVKRSWLRYAAAAVVTGVIVLSGFMIFGNRNTIDPNEKSFAWVEKSLKKVSTDDIDEFTELTQDGTLAVVGTKSEIREANEIKELIKDIPEKDLQEFIEETETSEPEFNNDEILLN